MQTEGPEAPEAPEAPETPYPLHIYLRVASAPETVHGVLGSITNLLGIVAGRHAAR